MPALAILLLLLLPIAAAVVIVYVKHAARKVSEETDSDDRKEYIRYRDRSLYYYLQSSRNGDLLREEEWIKTDFGPEPPDDDDPMPGPG